MKKYLVLFAIIGFTVITLYGCRFNKEKEPTYQECCATHDFETAHQILAKMQNKISRISDVYDRINAVNEYDAAKEYVFTQEALFLMSQGDDTAKKRIIYLLKEEGGNDDHVSMLIDLAMENDDADFVNTLIKQYTKEIKDEDIQKLFKFFVEKQDEGYIFKILTDIENKIPNRPAIGKVTLSSSDGFKYQCDAYSKAVKKYNDACRVILSSAIENHNDALAQKALSKIKSNINCVELPHKFTNDGYVYPFNVTVDNEDIKSAKSAYQEAVRSGAFR